MGISRDLDEALDVIARYGLTVKCPTCRKWGASVFTYGVVAFRCAGCRKEVEDCHCKPMNVLNMEFELGEEITP